MKIKILGVNYAINPPFKFKNNDPGNGHLFVRFKSNAEVLTSEGYVTTKPGDIIFYNCNEMIEYNSPEEIFVHDYMRFYLDKNEEYLLDIPTSKLFTFPFPSKAEDILRLMKTEYCSCAQESEETLNLLGKAFLITIRACAKRNNYKRDDNKYSELFKLRESMLSSPQNNWTIYDLAASVFLSPSYFQKLYKKYFGVNCISELINARVSKAKFFLSNTNKKEIEIADLCGYNSVEHFIRQFKKIVKCTPSEFRNNY